MPLGTSNPRSLSLLFRMKNSLVGLDWDHWVWDDLAIFVII